MNYISRVKTEKKYTPNCVIKIDNDFFAIRTPDSGLAIPEPYNQLISTLMLNAKTIDIKKVNTTVASYSFKLVDKNEVISALVKGNAENMIGKSVTIWLGRSRQAPTDDGLDFADYHQLPVTKVKTCDHNENAYNFTVTEEPDRMGKSIYDTQAAISGDILPGTTIILMRDDISKFPAAGMVRLDNEFISYGSKDDVTRQFVDCIRGELGTVPASHSADTMCFHTETITDNPLNVFLRIITSGGGGGAYDNLQAGLAIDHNLIDVAGIEAIRDNLFQTKQIRISLYNTASALKVLEDEILQPFNLRISYSLDSKLSIAVLDRAVFTPQIDVIDDDTIREVPKWKSDDSKIVNVIKINWDFDESTNKYRRYDDKTDDISINRYGKKNPLTFNFKSVRANLDGQAIVDEFARVLLTRLSVPTPEVEIKTQMDKSIKNIGDKCFIESKAIPAPDGTLNFSSDMECVSQSINFIQGEVGFKFAFTSFTKIRSAYVAPSDMILSISSQNKVGITAGRSKKYLIGWFMRLWDEGANEYLADLPNKIVGVDQITDELIFENNWSTPLTTNYRLRFAKYNDVINSQKRYAFVSDDGNNFADGKETYKVTY